MDYFSIQLGQLKGNSQELAISQLLAPGPEPLLHGLFSMLGRPLVLLADAVELRSPLLLVESLVLAAAGWGGGLSAVLAHPQLASPPAEALAPDIIMARMAYDGRLSGLMRSGPGYQHAPSVLVNLAARAAVIDYVHCLDLADETSLLDQLAGLSVLLLCGTHKKGRPAFDLYLGSLPGLVQGLRVVLARFDDAAYRARLIQGVWLLMVLCYVTQLRPVLDPSLVVDGGGSSSSGSGSGSGSGGAGGGDETHNPPPGGWHDLFAEFRDSDTVQGCYSDPHFLRALRSICEMRHSSRDRETFLLHAAWKLKTQWTRWIGLGLNPREETLNIRL